MTNQTFDPTRLPAIDRIPYLCSEFEHITSDLKPNEIGWHSQKLGQKLIVTYSQIGESKRYMSGPMLVASFAGYLADIEQASEDYPLATLLAESLESTLQADGCSFESPRATMIRTNLPIPLRILMLGKTLLTQDRAENADAAVKELEDLKDKLKSDIKQAETRYNLNPLLQIWHLCLDWVKTILPDGKKITTSQRILKIELQRRLAERAQERQASEIDDEANPEIDITSRYVS